MKAVIFINNPENKKNSCEPQSNTVQNTRQAQIHSIEKESQSNLK